MEALYKKGGVFKYPEVLQCGKGSDFKNYVTKLLKKHNVDIDRTTTTKKKYKHTYTTFLEALNKKLVKQLFNCFTF